VEVNKLRTEKPIAVRQAIAAPRLSVHIGPYLFILPKLVVFIVFMLIPLVWAILMTFQSGTMLRGLRFTGLNNYAKIIDDSHYWGSLGNSLYYSVLVIPIAIGGGLFLATLLKRIKRFRSVFIVLLLIPTVTSVVAASVVWGALYGVAVYLFMNHVVLPLSAVARRPFSVSTALVMVGIHIACVGLPIALMVRRYSPPPA